MNKSMGKNDSNIQHSKLVIKCSLEYIEAESYARSHTDTQTHNLLISHHRPVTTNQIPISN